MAKERLISGTTINSSEEMVNFALRPTSLDDYVGQPRLVEKLSIALAAAKQRNHPVEHVLLHGPPGLGKTTLAHVIANEMAVNVTVTSGPALTKGSDLVGTLTKLQQNDVLFIDEIHRLPVALEEYLYSAMEDFKIEFVVDSGMHAKTITLPVKPFSLIGATTRAGLLSGPMRSRFGITGHLEFYNQQDMLTILHRSASLLHIDDVHQDALSLIAQRSRGTPRIVNRLLRRVRDYAQIKTNNRFDIDTVEAALELEGVDTLGLDELDRTYLRTIADVYNGGPVGLDAIAATLNEDSGTLEDMIEPYLLQLGFLARTRRGRQLTKKSAEYLGLKFNIEQNGLFEPSD